MAFNGKYKLVSQENYETFMKATNVPDDLIEKGKNAERVTEIVQNGNHFVFTTTTGSNVRITEFTLGEEFEFDTATGDKVKTTVHLEGNKLISNFKGVNAVTELNGDSLITVMTFKDIAHKTVSKRI